MANTKMFVHYSGTKASFISDSTNLPELYKNSIVFIKGDGSSSPCIYTHGTYFANFTEFISAYVAAMHYVKGVKVGNTEYVATEGGGYIPFAASDPSTIALNVSNGTITVGLTEAFVNRVGSLEANLGTTDDSASATGSAFARIAALANAIGAEGSVAGQITSAINALRTEIVGTLDTSDSKTLAEINDELDAIDSKWSALATEVSENDGTTVKVTVKTKDGKVSGVVVDETTLNTELGKKANTSDVAETLQSYYTKTEADALLGSKADVSALDNYYTKDKTYTKEEVAGAISTEVAKLVNDAPDAYNTLGEIATWIAKHPESVAAINKEISDLKTLVGDTSVASQISTKVSALAKSDTAVTGQYVSAVSQTNGVITVTRANLPTYTLAEGSTDGTVQFNGNEVKVHGLGSAAYTEASAYATAAQGSNADSALQSIETGTDGTYVVTSVSAKSNNKQTVAVSVSVKNVADASVLGEGLADAYAAKSYTDEAQSAAQVYAAALFEWEEL